VLNLNCGDYSTILQVLKKYGEWLAMIIRGGEEPRLQFNVEGENIVDPF
jgi:hypothetical protein